MPLRYEWTPEQEKQVKAANQWIMDALAKVMPGSEYMGQEQYYPVTQSIANMAVPPTFQEAMQAALNTVGVGPMEIWSNYRTPAAIAQLRKLMAEEQRTRGPLRQRIGGETRLWGYEPGNPPYVYPHSIEPPSGAWSSQSASAIPEVSTYPEPDPADLILRGSWFHGMSEPARQASGFARPSAREMIEKHPSLKDYFASELGYKNFDNYIQKMKDITPEYNTEGWKKVFGNIEDHSLKSLLYSVESHHPNLMKIVPEEWEKNFLGGIFNQGLPASTHAIPGGYVRFGEPYGVSLTASPSVAAKFAADENIHRIMPLYGGPPTERTLQLWKPEHQKRFNEAYNEALNKLLQEPIANKPGIDIYGGAYKDFNQVLGDYLKYYQNPEEVYRYMLSDLQMARPMTEKFNIDMSNALQSQGVRGLLYNPRRFGEYEMLMLDPKYAQVLDYRPAGSYTFGKQRGENVLQMPLVEPNRIPMTPGTGRGYQLADPEFAANHARLHEMFGLMPWTERINQENWQRILSQVDPNYREAIINQLFGNR